jgi:glutamyl-tRNA synthetase/glutamyl-Q tRNA(Asp) synthetase
VVISRFAPAPTGYLHLGHVVNAVYVWGLTHAVRGRVLLRIEDHDRRRSRAEFERAILDDLDWLGFEPDAPPTSAFRAGACPSGRQSDRGHVYASALDVLRAAGLVYGCECSRTDIALIAKQASERRYPGTCARKGLGDAAGRTVRIRLHRVVETFDDLRHGTLTQCPADQCGDLAVRDRDGHWSYQFAATVDDLEQGITLVVRGDDLLASTGRQIQLARLLGRTQPPLFFHHPLVMKTPTQKLSKADRDTSVRDLRTAGATAAALIGRAAALAGLLRVARPLRSSDAAELVAERHPAALRTLTAWTSAPIG